ncbi:MAG: helix-hairpin-helix domain-containing protein [Deltaproteobacteria bacterium]|nr:helix-hairpin-helix domain-containing protein [Deltaproteobacteria bacterium]
MTHLKTFTAAALAFALLMIAVPSFAANDQVNINQAGADELSLLPRVGPAIAERIVDFRKENGPFKTLEDLMLVRGIGEKTFDLLKPYLRLSGETTLKEKARASRPADSGTES